jgi:hypothetical protein
MARKGNYQSLIKEYLLMVQYGVWRREFIKDKNKNIRSSYVSHLERKKDGDEGVLINLNVNISENPHLLVSFLSKDSPFCIFTQSHPSFPNHNFNNSPLEVDFSLNSVIYSKYSIPKLVDYSEKPISLTCDLNEINHFISQISPLLSSTASTYYSCIISELNDTVNELYLEEKDYSSLLTSILLHPCFNHSNLISQLEKSVSVSFNTSNKSSTSYLSSSFFLTRII